MDQIGEQHQFERQFCPVDSISPAAFQSLDTVRALHQTVVSLRTALEAAHREIDTLKRQIVVTTDIKDGKAYQIQEKDIILVHSEPSAGSTEEKATGEASENSSTGCHGDEPDGKPQTKPLKRKLKAHKTHHIVNVEEVRISDRFSGSKRAPAENIEVSSHSKSDKYPRQMASKIDVKIRLSSDIKVNGSSSETGSDSNSGKLL